MEDDLNGNKIIENPNPEIIIQAPIAKDFRKISQIAKAIAKLKKEKDELGTANLIQKSVAIQKILANLSEGKAKKNEIKAMKNIFYKTEDFDIENDSILALKDGKDEVAIQQIIGKICKDNFNQIITVLNNDEDTKNLNEFILSVKKNKFDSIIGKMSKDRQKDIKLIKESMDNSVVNEIKEWQDSIKKENIIKVSENGTPIKRKKKKNKKKKIQNNNLVEIINTDVPPKNSVKIENSNNKIEENKNEKDEIREKILKEIKEKRKAKYDVLNVAGDNADKAILKLKDLLWNLSSSDPEITGDEGDKQFWKKLANTKLFNVEKQLTDLLTVCFNNANGNFDFKGIISNLVKTIMSIAFSLNIHKQIIDEIKNYAEAKTDIETQIALHGNKGWNHFNKMIKFKQFAKHGNNYIDKGTWENLSPYEKYQKSFKFRDYNQFPKIRIWKYLSNDEKIKVLEDRNLWIKKRIPELIDNYKKKNSKSIKEIDTFMYYYTYKKDCKGYDVHLDEKQSELTILTGDDKLLLDEIIEIWKNEGGKKHIFNKVMCKGFGKFSNGRCSKIPYMLLPFNRNNSSNKGPYNKKINNRGKFNFLGRKRAFNLKIDNDKENIKQQKEDKNYKTPVKNSNMGLKENF